MPLDGDFKALSQNSNQAIKRQRLFVSGMVCFDGDLGQQMIEC